MKETFRKLFSYLMVFVMLIANPVTALVVNAEGESDTAVASVKIGIDKDQNYFDADASETLNEGDLVVTKSVETINAEKGQYRVKFSVTGKDAVETVTHPLYTVIVLDTSDSMDNQKMKDAQQALKNYSSTLADGTNQFALVLFDEASNSTYFNKGRWHFGPSAIRENELPGIGNTHPGTRYYLGLSSAKKIVDDARNANEIPDNAKVVIVFISDGAPHDGTQLFNQSLSDNNIGPTDILTPHQNLINIKNSVDEIYTIGYDLEGEANPARCEAILRNISTDLMNNYIAADEGELAAKVQTLANELKETPAASSITIKETPTSNFTLSGESEKTIEIDGDEISFDIQINKSLDSGVYPTNDIDQTTITYTGVDGEEHTVKINESPSINWERPSYSYTVNYFKDSVEGEAICDPETGTGEYSTEIPYDTNKTVKGYKFDHVEGPTTITDNSANNVLNVIYTKKDDLTYNVYYQYEKTDGTYEEVNPNISGTATYGDTIDGTQYKDGGLKEGFTYNSYRQTPGTIDDEEANRVDIIYTRNKYNYCVNYYYDGEEDEDARVTGNDYFGKVLTYEDKNKPGYRFDQVILPSDEDPATIQITEDDANPIENTIDVIYVRDEFMYTVEYYFDGVKDLDETREYTALYKDVITDYEEVNRDGYTFDSAENLPLEISYNEEENIIKIYYVSAKEEAIAIPNTGI